MFQPLDPCLFHENVISLFTHTASFDIGPVSQDRINGSQQYHYIASKPAGTGMTAKFEKNDGMVKIGKVISSINMLTIQ